MPKQVIIEINRHCAILRGIVEPFPIYRTIDGLTDETIDRAINGLKKYANANEMIVV